MKYFSFLFLIILFSCTHIETNNNQTPTTKQSRKQSNPFHINSPKNYDTLNIGESVDVSVSLEDPLKSIDSVFLYIDSKRYYSSPNSDFSIKLTRNNVGNGLLGIEVLDSNGEKQRKNINLCFLSDINPETINFSVVNQYPHSTEYFTEGFIYEDGIIYEGTGDWGKSGIFVYSLSSGEVLNSTFLSSSMFGEGITKINDKLVQLTYQSGEGYVYNKDDLRLIKKFEYSFTTEGWGLTTDGENLIMSNGSDKLYTMDSTYYSIIYERQVCDNKAVLDSINELEYVDGVIYANIWMDNRIAKIDYTTGKVLGYLDLSAIIPEKYVNHDSDVLNGIAYNKKNGNLLITGKRWDRIFEITIEQ